MRSIPSSRLPWCGACAAVILFASSASPQTAGPYDELTNNYRTATNLNAETTRGIYPLQSGGVLAINTHGSTLNLYGPSAAEVAPEPTAKWPTINNPIAIDVFVGSVTGPDRVYAVVAGSASHALVAHDLGGAAGFTTLNPERVGDVAFCLQLPAEAGDVIVDRANARAFVSLPGNNTVLQVGLPALTIEKTFTVASQRPRFLSLDSDGSALVVPERSGNNTIPIQGSTLTPTSSPIGPFTDVRAYSLDASLGTGSPPVGSGQPLWGGLPDLDLFRLDPNAVGTVVEATPVARHITTLGAGHGRHPGGEYYVLGVDCLNTQDFDEPSLKGVFARNQLTRIAASEPLDGAWPLPFSHGIEDLDLDMDGGVYAGNTSVSFPWDLAFHPSGYTAVTGSASDQLRILGPTGERVGDIELPEGSIPRSTRFDRTGNFLLVYCWGTNEVRIYNAVYAVVAMLGLEAQFGFPDLDADGDAVLALGPDESAVHAFPLDLGADPAPEAVKRGREHFYDADNSLNARTSCNHCHPGGEADGIGWNIQDFPHDHKDLMVTQSLKGIEDTFPYHWRGERDLEAFNVAFEGLLGGALLTEDIAGNPRPAHSIDTDGISFNETSEFEDFKAFVFSLQPHANPQQSGERELDSNFAVGQPTYDVVVNAEGQVIDVNQAAVVQAAGDPVAGQMHMDIPMTLQNTFSCTDCHAKVTGAVGDTEQDDVSGIPGNNVMDVAHFRQLFHKEQALTDVHIEQDGVNTDLVLQRGGYGISHDGNHSSVADFLLRNNFGTTFQQELDLAAFVQQADQGIAPAAHLAFCLDSNSIAGASADVKRLLIDSADTPLTALHWVDVAAFGWLDDVGGQSHRLRLAYDGATQVFEASDPSVVLGSGPAGAISWPDLESLITAGGASVVMVGVPPGNAHRWALDRDDDGSDDFVEESSATLDPDLFEPVDDGQSPSVVSARVDHEGATYLKLVLELSEPCEIELIATDLATGQQIVDRRFVRRRLDSMVLQRLLPSMPFRDYPNLYPIPDVQGVAKGYVVTINLVDQFGNPSLSPFVVSNVPNMKDHLALNPFPLDTQADGLTILQPGLHARTITAFDWSQTGPTNFRATATFDVRFDVPELHMAYQNPLATPNNSSDAFEKQYVAVQVLHLDDDEGTWAVLSDTPTGDRPGYTAVGNSTNPEQGSEQFDNVLFVTLDQAGQFSLGSPVLATPGQVMRSAISVTGPAGSDGFPHDGSCDLELDLSSPLEPGEKLKLNVVGIFEQAEFQAAAITAVFGFVPPETFWNGSRFIYSKPATPIPNRGLVFEQ